MDSDQVNMLFHVIMGRRPASDPPRARRDTGAAIGGDVGARALRRRDVYGPGVLIGGGTSADLGERPPLDTEGPRAARIAARRPRLPDTGLPPPYAIGPGGVVGVDSVGSASRATGVSPTYLSALIGHESAGNPKARASTSSATGAAQFIDSTWLRVMRQYGQPYGDDIADMSDSDMLELREDPTWSAIMAAEYGREIEGELRSALSRPVRENEVYLAHFLGSGDAVKLIRASQEDARSATRSRRAASIVSPASVEANRSVFYDGDRARTVGEVVALQSRNFSRDVFAPGERAHEAQEREERETQARDEEMQERARVANEARMRQRIEEGDQPNHVDLLLRAIMAPRRAR